MSRMSEAAESAAIGAGPMSKEALLLHLGFMAADLRRYMLANRGCLSERQEAHLKTIRMDLEGAARLGGQISEYIDGTAREPIASLQAAE